MFTLPQTTKKLPLGQVLINYNAATVSNSEKRPIIFSRGITNTGNICFMNSILQALIHCTPFNQLLDYVGKNSIHSMQSDTPLLDALIEFLGEFSQAPSTPSKMSNGGSTDAELRAYSATGGLTNVNLTPLSPESFYNKLRTLPRFQHLKRGRQEDAEEFLGYLLEALHDEFSRAMKPYGGGVELEEEARGVTTYDNNNEDDEWQEVGKNNRTLQIRQASGFGQTPITQLFGGQFKSILNVAKQKSPSITRDPFQHVQLDISDPAVHSIEDAFLHLAHLEELQFTTSTRQEVRATKQILIDAVPRILIIHLKRFSYMSTGLGGFDEVQKISKPISFPELLTIPREALSRSLASSSNSAGGTGTQPSYTLCGVVYHHGRSAGAGHYTVDVRTPDSSEQWINVDDISLVKTSTPLSPSGSPGTSTPSTAWNGVGGSSTGPSTGGGLESSKTAYILFYVQNSGV